MPSFLSISRFLLLTTIFLTPLLPYAWNFGFEQIKVIFFILFLTFASIFFQLHYVFKKLPFTWTIIKLFSFAFLISLSVSALFGLDPLNSFLGKEPYFQGVIIYLYLFLLLNLVSDLKIKLEEFSFVLTLSVLVISLIALKDYLLLTVFNQPVLTYSGRVISTFGQSNFYAGFIALSLPFIAYLFSKKYYTFASISLVLGVLAILVSFSRAAEFILIVLGLLFLMNYFKKQAKAIFLAAIILLILGLVLSYIYKAGVVWKEIGEPQELLWQQQNSPEKRIFIWEIASKVFLQNPILGVGLENFDLAYANYFKAINYNTLQDPKDLTLKDLVVNRAHSYPLDLAVWGGLVTLIIWSLLIFYSLKYSNNKYILTFFTIYLIWSLVQIESITHLILFWSVLGFIKNNKKENKKLN